MWHVLILHIAGQSVKCIMQTEQVTNPRLNNCRPQLGFELLTQIHKLNENQHSLLNLI